MLFREMKGVNFSCSSPASAAICTSIGRKSVVQPSIVGRPKPKHSPNLPLCSDRKLGTSTSTITSPTTSSTSTKSTCDSSSSRYLLDDTPFLDLYPVFEPNVSMDTAKKSKSLVLPTSSTRLIHSAKRVEAPAPFFTSKSYSEKSYWSRSLVPVESPRVMGSSEVDVVRPSSSTGSHHNHSHNEVVVLRVSLHCKGCEGKVRKHISKMEGVTSFNIDFATKKVTIMGEITPLGVLNSVSKVKNAQLWSSPLTPARASASF